MCNIQCTPHIGGRGKPSGGLCIWVASHLGCTVGQLNSQSNDIQCVVLTFSSKLKIAFINLYSRPVSLSHESLAFDHLNTFIASVPTNMWLIIGGDFNCQFEPLADPIDTIPSEEDLHWLIPDPQIPPIKAWTPLALHINSVTLTHSLRACNGRTKSDRPGKLTFNRTGQSCSAGLYFSGDQVMAKGC